MLIGELAEAAATTTKALRFYEQEGLLPAPVRTTGGYRDYPPETTHRLDFIRRGRAAGLSLAEIRQVLQIRDAGVAPCEHVVGLLEDRLTDLDRRIAELLALWESITALLVRANPPDAASCTPDQVCRYL